MITKKKLKITTFVSAALMAFALVSTSVTNVASARSFNNVQKGDTHKAGKNTARKNNSAKGYGWGHPCNDYGPPGSVNFRRGPINPVACKKIRTQSRYSNTN